ncbi:protein nessun dorma-like isoform X2 [Leptidea sinapis]|nr:protein nessun dorma-like isoform X2 [Leptidea sinapis]XP_050668416.1 protein nessun dorma-like isoform X2 [Leptidea sinapis]
MPAAYPFNKSDNEILRDLLLMFSSSQGTAKEQWSILTETLINQVGWDALWKLSKEFCKKFDERYPCVVFVSVTSVNSEELSANVEVLSVPHKDVTLPEYVMDVPLIELWPTLKQKDECVNAEEISEFIHLQRYFFENLWMPWDDQEKEFSLNTIENRMQLHIELNNGTIPNCVAREIIQLRENAINVHEKIQELDPLCDDDDSMSPGETLQDVELNARLETLMSKWTLYENPLIREQYVARAMQKWQNHKTKNNAVALWKGGDVSSFEAVSSFLKTHVSNEFALKFMVSFEDALALEPDEVFVCSDNYEVPEMPLSQISIRGLRQRLHNNGVTLIATDMRSCLLSLSKECQIHDMTLHCNLVTTVVAVRAGSLHLNNCNLLDDSTNSLGHCTQGIVACAGARIVIENCTFENFYLGIVVHQGAQVQLKNCHIKRCGVGIEMYSGSEVTLQNSTILDCSEKSIRYQADDVIGDTNVIEGLHVSNTCKIGNGDLNNEIEIIS